MLDQITDRSLAAWLNAYGGIGAILGIGVTFYPLDSHAWRLGVLGAFVALWLLSLWFTSEQGKRIQDAKRESDAEFARLRGDILGRLDRPLLLAQPEPRIKTLAEQVNEALRESQERVRARREKH